MKPSFPNIWKNSSGIKSKKLGIESLDLSDYILKPSCKTPHEKEDFLEKELNRLENELDAHEIKIINTASHDFSYYKIYLEGISSLVKQKFPILGQKLMRGIHGWEKSLKKAEKTLEKNEKKIIVQCTTKIDADTQTMNNEIREKITESDIEFLRFLNLKKSIKKIHIGKLAQKLKEIYDKLKVIQTDLPSGSQTPEIHELNLNFTSVENTEHLILAQEIEKSQTFKRIINGKLMIFKDTQTEKNDFTETNYQEELNIEKELNILQKKRELENINNENRILKQKINILNSKISELSSGNLKNGAVDDKINDISENNFKLQMKQENLKKNNEIMNEKLTFQQNYIKRIEENLRNTKILFRVSEIKLKDIEESWINIKGTPYKHKNIRLDEIIDKIHNSLLEDEESISKMLNDLRNSNIKRPNLDKKNENFSIDLSDNTNLITKSSNPPSSRRNLKKDPSNNEKKIEEIKRHTEKKRLSMKKEEKNFEESKKNDDYRENLSDSFEEIKSLEKDIEETEKIDEIIQEKTISPRKIRKKFSEVISETPKPKNASVISEKKTISGYQTPILSKKTPQTTKYSKFHPNVSTPNPPNFSNSADFDNSLDNSLQKKKNLRPLPKSLTLENIEIYLGQVIPQENVKAIKEFFENILLKSKETSQNFPENIFIPNNTQNNYFKSEKDPRLKSEIFEKTEKEKRELGDSPLRKVFEQEEIKSLSPHTRAKIQRAMIGHDKKCTEVCEHLKRALAIKYKASGIRYPINSPIIKPNV